MNNVAVSTVLAALLAGGAIGALLMWLWCARRIKTQDALRDQLQAVFGELARDSLQSNNEVFLQLAAERGILLRDLGLQVFEVGDGHGRER